MLSFSIEHLTSARGPSQRYSNHTFDGTPPNPDRHRTTDDNALADSESPESTSPNVKWLNVSPDSGISSPPPSEPVRTESENESAKVGLLAAVEHNYNNVSPPPTPLASNSAEKPTQSYIELISTAILRSAEHKLVLSDIYQYIMDNFAYYNNHERAWRNSIRHNLSLNECFVKSGRAENGKGHYWAVHPACAEDFAKGDFRRRQARRRARTNGSCVTTNVSALPMAYRCNMGYVPMTLSPGYHPYASPYLPLASAVSAPSSCRLPYGPPPTQYNVPALISPYAASTSAAAVAVESSPILHSAACRDGSTTAAPPGVPSVAMTTFPSMTSMMSPSLVSSNYFTNVISSVGYSPYGMSSYM